MTLSPEEQTAHNFLPDLQDYNTVSSLKNEKAAAIIRMLLNKIEADRRTAPKPVESVWMIELCQGDPGYGNLYEIIDDYGFFLSERDAQNQANALNAPREQYELEALSMNVKLDAQIESYRERKASWEKLEEAGLDASAYMTKPKYPNPFIPTYDMWASERPENYRAVKVNHADLDKSERKA